MFSCSLRLPSQLRRDDGKARTIKLHLGWRATMKNNDYTVSESLWWIYLFPIWISYTSMMHPQWYHGIDNFGMISMDFPWLASWPFPLEIPRNPEISCQSLDFGEIQKRLSPSAPIRFSSHSSIGRQFWGKPDPWAITRKDRQGQHHNLGPGKSYSTMPSPLQPHKRQKCL